MPHGVPLAVSTLTEKKLFALLQLLGDRDASTRALVEKSLAEMGPSVLHQLRAVSDKVSPEDARRLEELAFVVPRRPHLSDLATLVETGGDAMDLEAGLWCLARFRDPELATILYTRELERLSDAIRSRLDKDRTAYHVLKSFIQVVFDEEAFRGNEEDYYDPDNSFLHKVLERRRGIPISLSALCMLIGHRLEVPIAGVGLPGHFICRFGGGEKAVYFDPFNGGRVMTREGCAVLCQQMGFTFSEEYLTPYTNREILIRMVRNLREIFIQRESPLDLGVLDDYLRVLLGDEALMSDYDEPLDEEVSGEETSDEVD